MIEQALTILEVLDLAPENDAIILHDGDALEISIIRDGQRQAMFNMAHYDLTEAGERIPVKPLAVQVSIAKYAPKRAAPPEQGRGARRETISQKSHTGKKAPAKKARAKRAA